jgi:hypothetical protein
MGGNDHMLFGFDKRLLREAARAFGQIETMCRSGEKEDRRKGSKDAVRLFGEVLHGAQHIDFRCRCQSRVR